MILFDRQRAGLLRHCEVQEILITRPLWILIGDPWYISPCQSLSYQLQYSHADRGFGLGLASSTGGGSEALMKVWLMVLTTIPYSSTSARRQSKKACAACLDAASDIHTQAQRGVTRLYRSLIPCIAEDTLILIVCLWCDMKPPCSSHHSTSVSSAGLVAFHFWACVSAERK